MLSRNFLHLVRSRLPTKGNIARSGLDVAASCQYVQSIFAKVDKLVTASGGWEGKSVLEIGPGDSLGTGLLVLAHGAQRYQAIDRFAVSFDPAGERQIFAALQSSLPEPARQRLADVIALSPDGFFTRSERFAYTNSLPLESAPAHFGEQSFDVIYSNAVLEHVRDLEASLRAIRRLLAPGGVMLYAVDLRSHQNYERHALEFLEYPRWFYSLMTSHTGAPNRARFSRYDGLLRAQGFLDLDYTIEKRYDSGWVEKRRPHLAREFRSLDPEDLSVATFQVIGRLPSE